MYFWLNPLVVPVPNYYLRRPQKIIMQRPAVLF